jgi:hypothetical protein
MEEYMKKFTFLAFLLMVPGALALAQFPHVTIRQIQEMPLDSLRMADTLSGFSANSNQALWTLQASPYNLDTVTVTGLCVVPAKVITYSAGGWTMVLCDTAAANQTQWGGVLVRGNAPADTTQLLADGFLNVAAGDIIEMTGLVSEFPTLRGFSLTQFQPIAGKPISIIGSGKVPKPVVKNVGDFYKGVFPNGKIQYSTGEPFEGFYVEFHNLTIDNKVNTARGTFSAVDSAGNEISEYDMSHSFTLGHGGSLPFPADTAWQRLYAGLGNGLRIDTLRGIITTSSGSEGPRGYRIAPLYPSDVVLAKAPAPPLITAHRRNPVVVSPDTTATISVKVTRQANGSSPSTVSLIYSAGNAAFIAVPMSFSASDTTYVGVIPKQATNTLVRYFVQVADSFAQVIRLANSATSGIASDTSKGFFFYNALNRPLTIRDVQYTPYINGRTPYLGAVTALSGIITADTANIALTPLSTGWTNAWYMQSTSQPWSGIWLTTTDTIAIKQMDALRNGDSVTVTGTIQEQFDVTRLGNITGVVKVSGGNALPAPVALTTSGFNVGNGTPSAESYEGMLVKFTNLTVTDINPTFSDPSEYSVNDGSGPVVVQQGGRNKYSNVPADSAAGKTIFHVGNKIGSLTGIVYYSFNQYKFVPRTDADFQNVVLTGVKLAQTGALPASYALSQNYPNPFNPSTVIQYALPASGSVTLKVFNILGQEVRTLVNEFQAPGRYAVRFDASSLASGMYFYRIQSGSYSSIMKMMVIK